MKQLFLQWYPPYILDLLPLPNWMPLFFFNSTDPPLACQDLGRDMLIVGCDTFHHMLEGVESLKIAAPTKGNESISHNGKGKIIDSKVPAIVWDILVARKVYDTSSLGVSYINNVHMHKFIWANCVTRLDLVSKAIHVMVCPDVNYVL